MLTVFVSAQNSFSLAPKQHSRTELGTHPTSFPQAVSRSAHAQWTKTSGTPPGHPPSGMEHRPPDQCRVLRTRGSKALVVTKSRSHTSSNHPERHAAGQANPSSPPPVGPEAPHVRNWEPCKVRSFLPPSWRQRLPLELTTRAGGRAECQFGACLRTSKWLGRHVLCAAQVRTTYRQSKKRKDQTVGVRQRQRQHRWQ